MSGRWEKNSGCWNGFTWGCATIHQPLAPPLDAYICGAWDAQIQLHQPMFAAVAWGSPYSCANPL